MCINTQQRMIKKLNWIYGVKYLVIKYYLIYYKLILILIIINLIL